MALKLNFDKEFIHFLLEVQNASRIAAIALYHNGHFLKKNGDYIKRDGPDSISFIPKGKLGLLHAGFNEEKLRTSIKIGRFISKFMMNEGLQHFGTTQNDVDVFVNCFKSYFDRDETNLKIVSGDDILKYYLENFYNESRIGTLWQSCMRYAVKNPYMKIYADNPDKVKMLVKFDEKGKVKTRALLWEDCTDRLGNKHKVMDRIYSVFEHDVVLFKNWAHKNGYSHRYEQSARNETLFTDPTGRTVELDLTIKIENHKQEFYPYLDTFKYYSRKNGTISNSRNFPYKWVLIQNNGDFMSPDQRDEYHDNEGVLEF